jgi:pimeloyl-ACP methyl ester carboxylesterase
MPRIQLFKNLYKDRFFYQLYFQEPGVAEAEFEADLRTALRKIYYQASGDGRKDGPRPPKPADAKYLDGLVDPDPFPAWLTATDLDYYVGQFEQSGFRGPLNRYRTAEIDFAQQAEIADRRIEQPAAFIAGQLDPVLAFIPGVDLVEVMRQHVTDLRLVRIIDGAGHWIQQERPNEVNTALLEWLGGIV